MSWHHDTHGPRGKLTPMVCLSGSSFAHIILEDLGETLYFSPGTLLLIRGGEMNHAILGGEWQKQVGVRTSIVHFSHWLVWNKNRFSYDWKSDSGIHA